MQPHAEGTVPLARAGLGVDPVFGEGTLGKGPHALGEAVELLDDEAGGFGIGPGPAFAGDGGEEIVPGQLLQPQDLGLGPEVAAEVGEGVPGRAQHGVQDGLVDAVVEEGGVQHGGPAPALGQGGDFALDPVEGGGDGHAGPLPHFQLGLVGGLAHGPVGVIGQVAGGAHGHGFFHAVDLHLDRELGGEVALEFGPGAARAQVEFAGQVLLRRGHEVFGLFGAAAQEVGVVRGHVGGQNQGFHVQVPDPGGEPGVQQGVALGHPLIFAHAGLGVVVAGVHGGVADDVGAQGAGAFDQVVEAAKGLFKNLDRGAAGAGSACRCPLGQRGRSGLPRLGQMSSNAAANSGGFQGRKGDGHIPMG